MNLLPKRLEFLRKHGAWIEWWFSPDEGNKCQVMKVNYATDIYEVISGPEDKFFTKASEAVDAAMEYYKP